MKLKFYLFILITVFLFSCSKPPVMEPIVNNKDKAYEVYRIALEEMDKGDFFFASKKFTEAESILTEVEYASKASLMSSYCLYLINFYEESTENLEKFLLKYPADKNVPYARYLLIMNTYETILDEKKDIAPLNKTKFMIEKYLIDFPKTEYSLDLSFKLDLINNQLAAKELYIAKYYIKIQKWIPAINRLKNIVKTYDETIFIEEALHRLVEIYYKIGLIEEAKYTAKILGYNYNSSDWYENSYKIINKDYQKKLKRMKKNKSEGLIKRTIKKIIN